MADEDVPKRRSSDPVPGTKGPQRGNNDAFRVKETLQRESEPKATPPKPFEGVLARERRKGIDLQIERAENPQKFKRGGAVRGWGKARKKGC